MTNYEVMMKNMTPEQMAEKGVQLVVINNNKFFYMTSSGQLDMNTVGLCLIRQRMSKKKKILRRQKTNRSIILRNFYRRGVV